MSRDVSLTLILLATGLSLTQGRAVTTIDIEGDKPPPIIINGQTVPPIFEILALI